MGKLGLLAHQWFLQFCSSIQKMELIWETQHNPFWVHLRSIVAVNAIIQETPRFKPLLWVCLCGLSRDKAIRLPCFLPDQQFWLPWQLSHYGPETQPSDHRLLSETMCQNLSPFNCSLRYCVHKPNTGSDRATVSFLNLYHWNCPNL